MSTYITVADVLEKARRFHQQLEEFYERLSRESDRERLRLLLDYMRRHEDHFTEGLKQYADQGQERLLETWLQYGPDEKPLELPPVRELADGMSLDDIQEAALQFDDTLAAFYDDAASLVQSDEVRHLFRDLAEQHEADKATIRKNVEAVKHDM